MGIFRLQSEKAEANKEAVKHLVAELYVERMEFEYKPAAVVDAGTTATTPAPPASPAREVVPAARMTLKRPG
jgi:hypothetical protein